MRLAYNLYPGKRKDLEPMVLIHGMVDTRTTYLHIGPNLAEKTGRDVYCPDLRNHGESPYSKEYNVSIHCEDLAEFFEQRGLKKIILLGFSMGGNVVMTFAMRYPDIVVKLIVEDARPRNIMHRNTNLVPISLQLFNDILNSIPEQSDEREAQIFLTGLVKNFLPTMRVSEKLVDTIDWKTLPFKWNGKAMEIDINMKDIVEVVARGELMVPLKGTFSKDTLFIYGCQSQAKLENDSDVLRHFPRAIKIGYEKAGHFLHQEFPTKFTNDVADFVNGKWKAKL